MLDFLNKIFGVSYKNPQKELGEVKTQDDNSVKFTWDASGEKFTRGSDNVFRDIGCENSEELLEKAEAKYANEYLSETVINNVDLFNEISLEELSKRKHLDKFKELIQKSEISENAPKITLNHLSKRQLAGILGTTENALKETKDKLKKANLEFTIEFIKNTLWEKDKNEIREIFKQRIKDGIL